MNAALEPASRALTDGPTVGPFTGFGNFFRKEFRDWWHSWRLLLVFAVPTLFQILTVFFAFPKIQKQFAGSLLAASVTPEAFATTVLLQQFIGQNPVLFVIIIIFSTMGLLTSEKSSGTLAWNLTKPLGRTGVLVAKWLMATLMLWLAMCVLPVVIATACLVAYRDITPNVGDMIPVLAVAVGWVGLWVLLMLTVALAFESPAAVGGVGIAFWIVPFLFGSLLGEVFGKETRDWIFDRMATRSPFWAYPLTARNPITSFGTQLEPWKEVWLWAYGVWMVGLGAFSLRVFSRQEVGS